MSTFTPVQNQSVPPRVDSIYRLIILAGLRSKQLLRGSKPRIDADPLKRKNTSIALEEIRQGLVPFTVDDKSAAFKTEAPYESLQV